MKISIHQFPGEYDKKECFVQARICPLSEKDMVMTLQKLIVSGSDWVKLLNVCVSHDGGQTFTQPKEEASLAISDDTFALDVYHHFSQKTRKGLLYGLAVRYSPDGKQITGRNVSPVYAVFNEKTEHYDALKRLALPEENLYTCHPSASQVVETPSGQLLMPMNVTPAPDARASSRVALLNFDGETLSYVDHGNDLSFEGGRGLYEPSLCTLKGKYFLTLRNDEFGFWSLSDDGLHFDRPHRWRWSDGTLLPTYNTQQHWLVCGGKLFLIYTRRGAGNDHVFRHRAPLFMAEVDTQSMGVIKSTEQIVVPERGARLGNFGVTQITPTRSLVTVAEWMQPAGCERYGADNSIFVTEVRE